MISEIVSIFPQQPDEQIHPHALFINGLFDVVEMNLRVKEGIYEQSNYYSNCIVHLHISHQQMNEFIERLNCVFVNINARQVRFCESNDYGYPVRISMDINSLCNDVIPAIRKHLYLDAEVGRSQVKLM